MAVSQIIARGTVIDRDSLMEFIIIADHARRLAIKQGDLGKAVTWKRETDKLIEQWGKLK